MWNTFELKIKQSSYNLRQGLCILIPKPELNKQCLSQRKQWEREGAASIPDSRASS